MKLTQTKVDDLLKQHRKSPETDKFIPDDDLPNFGLRLRPSKATWTVQYRLGGRGSPQRKVTIGTVEQFDLKPAREAAREILAKVRLGADPQNEKAAARAAATQTVNAVAEMYLKRAEGRVKTNSLKETARYLRQHWAALASVPVAKLDRAMVATELNKITDKSGGYAGNRARGALSAMLSWAMREGLAPSNPAAQTNKPLQKEVKRDRVLSKEELRAVWIEALSYGGDFGAIIRLLILTGARRDEVGEMLWSEVDLAGGVWTLGADRAKNGQRHDVPLSRPTLEILTALKDRQKEKYDGDAPTHVFGKRGTGFSGWSKAKEILDARILARLKTDDPKATLQPWRLHDLRRTASTGWADIGVQPHIIEACLNHISGHKGGVAGVYNRSSYGPEKRDALDAWAAHVVALVGLDNYTAHVLEFGSVAANVDENAWEAAVHEQSAEDVAEGAITSGLRRASKQIARTAGHKITPGAKVAANERNRPFNMAARNEYLAGETNIAEIARRATGKAREHEQKQELNRPFDEAFDRAAGSKPKPALKTRKTSDAIEKTKRRLVKNQMV